MINYNKNKMKQLYNILENYNLKFISILCILLSIYFLILIINKVKPLTYNEKLMHCLELGSDSRAIACVELVKIGAKK